LDALGVLDRVLFNLTNSKGDVLVVEETFSFTAASCAEAIINRTPRTQNAHIAVDRAYHSPVLLGHRSLFPSFAARHGECRAPSEHPFSRRRSAVTQRQLNTYRDRLQNFCNRVDESAQSIEKQARQSIGTSQQGDSGTATSAQQIGAALLENEERIEAEILAALDRIDRGVFGNCEGCGKSIAHDRLEALPYARHCIKCAKAFAR
jgi:RNA polymerase-binding transcription factor DksA